MWIENLCVIIIFLLGEARAMWFEKIYLWVKFVERNVFYPLLFLAALNDSVPLIKEKFGVT